ncbi:FxSxx-COOH system tetratricopeptide repeat protein, partial [Candidatus Chloroploca sp. Khr17]|uniref:FxSxx-COOH system tetratricopeptide repeat protein n=1 Tax=Candidatus Chloroploca sp. Khr17 TaxID=2496869 RepID=UPI0013ECBFF7
MPPTPPADDPLTIQARAGLRRTRWPALLAGAGGAATLGLLGAAGLAPLLAGLGVGTLATGPVVAWLTGMGMNALAGWIGNLAADGVQAALAEDEPDPAWVATLGQRLDAAAVSDQALATELARLLRTLDALPQALAAIAEEQGAQSDLLRAQYDLLTRVSADMERLHVSGGALGPAMIAEADRVIAALTARSDARFDEVIAALTALRDTQRQALVDFGSGNQFRDVTMGDVAGRDVNKNAGDVIYGDKVFQQAFTPRPVAATAEELAAAQATLAALPTATIPPPQDVLPPGAWLGGLRRNHQFVGREADLLALATLLKGGQSVAVNQGQAAVASGLGGIGKTQLAVEFAARYGQHFAGVFWLSFAQPDTIPTEFARLGGAAHLQLFTDAAGLKLNEQVNLVRSRLACGLPYLLIFDNCEDPQLVRAHHPGGATRVLITSRNPAWPGDLGVQRHALGVLSRAESCELLRQHRPDLRDQEADELAQELGDLPLALHLAGRFLASLGRRWSGERYLQELRSPRLFDRLPLREQDGTLPTGHNRDVARSFALSYERLDPAATEDALALKLLARAAHLVPGEVVPTALLLATLAQADDDTDAELVAEAALDRLVALGLIERDGAESLRMHRLVGAYVRQVSADPDAQAAVERVVIRVSGNMVDAPTLAPITAFLPILRGFTDAAMGREDARAADLCLWLGRHLDRLGSYALAQPYAERALDIRERVLGPEHPNTALSLNNLAGLLDAQGNYDAARPLYERALALSERVLGPEHPQTAGSLNNLAGLHYAQGNYDAARPLYERALALSERVLGPEHPQTATSLNNLAGLHQAQGNYDAARPLYERALALRERVLGPEHPQTAGSLNNLALLHYAQGNYRNVSSTFGHESWSNAVHTCHQRHAIR